MASFGLVSSGGQEADVSSDVTASEDEAVGPDDDLYEASFVDDLAATQHHSEESVSPFALLFFVSSRSTRARPVAE